MITVKFGNWQKGEIVLQPEGTPTAEEASFSRLASSDGASKGSSQERPLTEEEILERSIRQLREDSELANRVKNNFSERVTPSVTEVFSDWPVSNHKMDSI